MAGGCAAGGRAAADSRSNGTRQTLPTPRSVVLHELFEEQVERTPTAVAVQYEDQTLSYAELNAQANQLARYLQGAGSRGRQSGRAVHGARSADGGRVCWES